MTRHGACRATCRDMRVHLLMYDDISVAVSEVVVVVDVILFYFVHLNFRSSDNLSHNICCDTLVLCVLTVLCDAVVDDGIPDSLMSPRKMVKICTDVIVVSVF